MQKMYLLTSSMLYPKDWQDTLQHRNRPPSPPESPCRWGSFRDEGKGVRERKGGEVDVERSESFIKKHGVVVDAKVESLSHLGHGHV